MTTATRIFAHSTSPRRMRVSAFAFEPRVPPTEIQLWNVGDNPTDYGVHKWTARSAAAVLARYGTRGNPLLIDVEHNVGKALEAGVKCPVDGPRGGYARLEIRAGAPWLVFDWSAYAVDQISSGSRRFLSPEYDVDPETDEIVALFRVSLVAEPGTHQARVLASAQQETGPMNLEMILAALRAALAAEDPAVAKESIANLVAELAKGAAAAAGTTGDTDVAAAGTDDADGAAAGGDVAAGGDAGGGDAAGGDKTDEEKKVAAAAAAAKVAAAAKAAGATTTTTTVAATVASNSAIDGTATVKAAADAAVTQINNAQRDHLIQTQGERLEPSIRRWASAQPLDIVRGLINATPAKTETSTRIAATRGATQGQAGGPGLQGKDLEDLQKAMGTFKATAEEPGMKNGVLSLPSVSPTVHRERKRIAAAAAVATAGKVGS